MPVLIQRILTALGAGALIAGCGLPMSVQQVPLNTPVKGIPYVLKRPSYVVGVRLDAASVIDLPGNPPKIAVDLCQEATGVGCPAASGAPFCVRNKSEIAIVVRQTMDGTPLLYQVGAPDFWTGVGNSFAETDVSITLTDDGALSAVSAGATDRSLEFIQAVASIAIDAAKSTVAPAAAAAPARGARADCFVIPGDGFPRYVRRQRELLQAQAQLTRTLESSVAALSAVKPTKLVDALDGIAALRAQRDAVDAQLAEHLLPLDRDSYTLTIDGTDWNKGTTPLVGVTLTNRRFTAEAK